MVTEWWRKKFVFFRISICCCCCCCQGACICWLFPEIRTEFKRPIVKRVHYEWFTSVSIVHKCSESKSGKYFLSTLTCWGKSCLNYNNLIHQQLEVIKELLIDNSKLWIFWLSTLFKLSKEQFYIKFWPKIHEALRTVSSNVTKGRERVFFVLKRTLYFNNSYYNNIHFKGRGC